MNILLNQNSLKPGLELLDAMTRSRGPNACKRQTILFAACNLADYGLSVWDQARVWSENFCCMDHQMFEFVRNYLDTNVHHWTKGHGSYGSFTFDAVAKTIRFEFKLLGVVQSSTSYPIGKELP
jgi:hypothetical protein